MQANDTLPANSAARLAACVQAVSAFLDEQLEALFATARQTLLVAARDVGLGLVETAKLDDWVRLRRLLARHTEQSRALETRVWERLATTAGVSSPHPDDSPLS